MKGWLIEDTLRALAAQDYPAESYEVLLINDASKDDTQEIADRMGRVSCNSCS